MYIWLWDFEASAKGASKAISLATNIAAILVTFLAILAWFEAVLRWAGNFIDFSELNLTVAPVYDDKNS